MSKAKFLDRIRIMRETNFPILKRRINGRRLVYLDNASTTQKPRAVIAAISGYYEKHNANIHRGIHTLSQEATSLYEGARDKVQKFINAQAREEIIFTRGATESINLVVWTWGHENINRGDEILLSEMEHHSNLVPWQILARKKGTKLKFIPVHQLTTSPHPSPDLGRVPRRQERSNHIGRLDLRNLNKLLTRRTKIVALTHVSNVLGTVNPVEKIIKAAHRRGAKVLIDGAQAGGHVKIDVQKIGCDFYVLSGHKMYGPTGVGVLYGKKQLLEKMPPYQAGGHMIRKVDWQKSTWNELPYKFEAGTASIAEVIGLGAAVDFLNSPLPNPPRQGEGNKKKFPSLDGRGKGRVIDAIEQRESQLTTYALKKLEKIPGLTIYGPKDIKDRIGVISFTLPDIPAHDLASILDSQGIAIRAGHHCAMPLHQKFGVEGTARVSLAVYNTKEDIDRFINVLLFAKRKLSL